MEHATFTLVVGPIFFLLPLSFELARPGLLVSQPCVCPFRVDILVGRENADVVWEWINVLDLLS